MAVGPCLIALCLLSVNGFFSAQVIPDYLEKSSEDKVHSLGRSMTSWLPFYLQKALENLLPSNAGELGQKEQWKSDYSSSFPFVNTLL